MNSQTPQPLVLEYKRRRFDGGTERDMIEQIEHHQRMMEQQRMAAMQAGHRAPMPMPASAPNAQAVAQPVAYRPNAVSAQEAAVVKTPAKRTVKTRLYKAFVVPYVELILGLSGLLIGNLIGHSFMRQSVISPEVLRQERKALIHHSWSVIGTSLVSIATSPLQAVKLCWP